MNDIAAYSKSDCVLIAAVTYIYTINLTSCTLSDYKSQRVIERISDSQREIESLSVSFN